MENTTAKAHRPINIAEIKCTQESLCRVWVEFLTPYHHLTKRQRDVFAVIMSQYFRIMFQCGSKNMVRTLLWSSQSRADMRRMLGMSQPHFQMVLAKLRECGVLRGDDINPRYLPHITPDSRSIEMRVIFDYSNPQNKEMPVDEIIGARQ